MRCSEPLSLTPEMLGRVRTAVGESELDWAALPDGFRRAVGCPECAGGFRGRFAVAEILEVDGQLSDAVRRGAETAEIRTIALRQGMTTLAAAGMRDASEGRTTIEEVLRVL